MNSISFAEEPSWEVRGPWSNPGHRAYFRNSLACRDYFFQTGSNCGICFAKCPYAQPDRAALQELLANLYQAEPKVPAGCRDPKGWWQTKHTILGLEGLEDLEDLTP